MDGREEMKVSEPPSYFTHRGFSGFSSGTPTGGYNTASPGFSSLFSHGGSNQSIGHGTTIGGGYTPFSIEAQQQLQANFIHVNQDGAASEVQASVVNVKRKRGRPRKYGPDGASLGLSPMSGSSVMQPSPPKNGRGRPPGSGRKQQLASLGGWMNSSAGSAFAPHVISIEAGEDILSKILSFSQQKPRAFCVLSASGTISTATLRQPTANGTAKYEGRFEILCLSGSYLVSETGGPRERSGGLNISLSSPEGHVFGGVVGGMLIAYNTVQVVACSFVSSGSHPKEKTTSPKEEEESVSKQIESSIPISSRPSSRPKDLKNPHADIDLTRG